MSTTSIDPASPSAVRRAFETPVPHPTNAKRKRRLQHHPRDEGEVPEAPPRPWSARGVDDEQRSRWMAAHANAAAANQPYDGCFAPLHPERAVKTPIISQAQRDHPDRLDLEHVAAREEPGERAMRSDVDERRAGPCRGDPPAARHERILAPRDERPGKGKSSGRLQLRAMGSVSSPPSPTSSPSRQTAAFMLSAGR